MQLWKYSLETLLLHPAKSVRGVGTDMARLFSLLAYATLAQNVAAAPVDSRNLTLTVPAETTLYPETKTLCFPASVFDIVIFFLANYVTHATTVGDFDILTCQPKLWV